MAKNGLFLCSIGLLIVIYSLNPGTMEYDILNMTTGFCLLGLGLFFFFKGKRKEDAQKKNKGDK